MGHQITQKGTYSENVLKVSNRTSNRVGIGSGITLAPGQTRSWYVSMIEDLATLVKRLDHLVTKQQVSYVIQPAPAGPGSAIMSLRAGVIGTLSAGATDYLQPDFTLGTTPVSGAVVTRACRLSRLFVRSNTAPGGVQTDTYSVIVVAAKGGSPIVTGITASIVGTATAAEDLVHYYDAQPGDMVCFKVVAGGATSGANVLVALEVAG
jgi:hypothetical protein